jgi:acetyl esterase/lipase
MKWFWDAYEPRVASRKKPTVSPLQAPLAQLKGLPPALLITDENDVLRDEGEAYGRNLTEAGVKVTAVRCLQTIHDFAMRNPIAGTPATRTAIGLVIAHLSEALGTASARSAAAGACGWRIVISPMIPQDFPVLLAYLRCTIFSLSSSPLYKWLRHAGVWLSRESAC